MMKFDLAQDTTHFRDQNLITAFFDGAVSKQSGAVFAVGEEFIVPPGVRIGRECDDLYCKE